MDAIKHPKKGVGMRYRRDEKGQIIAEESDEVPESKEEGRDRWIKEMELRFVRGNDGEFDYEHVDGKEVYDDQATIGREQEEEWFEKEEPRWVPNKEDQNLVGETGVQDY